MGIFDIFKVKQFKNEISKLTKENEEMQKVLTPEMQQVVDLNIEIIRLKKDIDNIEESILKKKNELASYDRSIEEKKKEIIILDQEALMQSFGLYTPLYNLMSSAEYKAKIDSIREKQKDLIRNKTAVHFPVNWTVDGSKAKGKKMINDNIKQILRSFNTECDAVIDKVKFNNIESIKNKITKSYTDLNKLNQVCGVSIMHDYLNLKLDELNLCYEYELKKQEEKEEQQRLREQMREEQKVLKEIEAAKQKIEKEEKHFSQEIQNLQSKLETAGNKDKEKYLSKIKELEEKLKLIEKDKQNVFEREQNTRAGYVYVISNIGSFGENVYKIGMTRRLEPLDRVKELGDASVPFNFDVHAMIFAEDAPTLENELHKHFDLKRINKINDRREFFKVTLSEIEHIVKKHHNKTVEFTKIAQADEYRQSLMIENTEITEASA